MPIPPYTWQTSDFLTASRLNGELYTAQGVAFAPTGIAFHAGCPLYKSAAVSGASYPALATGTWFPLGSTASATFGNADVVGDSAGRWGARMDPNFNQTALLALLDSGGVSGSPGGLGLFTTFIPFVTGAANLKAGIGGVQNGATGPGMTGTIQYGNASQQVAPWACDIVDLNGTYGAVSGWGLSNQASPGVANNLTASDGSGRCARIGCHWCSSYLNHGTTVSSLQSPRADWSSPPVMTSSVMNGSTGLAGPLNLLNMPPLLRVQSTTTTSIAGSGTYTTVNLGAATYDSYGKWNSGSNTYTAPLAGLYFIAGFVPFDNVNTTFVQAGVNINGSVIGGPRSQSVASTPIGVSKAGIFDLHSGDTVQLQVQQSSGGGENTSSSTPSTFVILYLGGSGTPSFGTAATPPDISYRWTAGTPASSMVALMNDHIANDLNFLSCPPYLLSYQSVNQGYTAGTPFLVNMGNQSGLVHATAGDPWGGWSSSNHYWQAPVSGWYLCVYEVFFVQPGDTSGVCDARFQCGVNGSSNTDLYQIQNLPSGVGSGGATAVGYYYLRAGDSIAPYANQTNGSTGLTTSGTSGVNSHFECVWVGE